MRVHSCGTSWSRLIAVLGKYLQMITKVYFVWLSMTCAYRIKNNILSWSFNASIFYTLTSTPVWTQLWSCMELNQHRVWDNWSACQSQSLQVLIEILFEYFIFVAWPHFSSTDECRSLPPKVIPLNTI